MSDSELADRCVDIALSGRPPSDEIPRLWRLFDDCKAARQQRQKVYARLGIAPPDNRAPDWVSPHGPRYWSAPPYLVVRQLHRTRSGRPRTVEDIWLMPEATREND